MPDAAKYMSVFEKPKSEILEGNYRSARVFPSSTALARRFKTTRATVRRALDLLRNQGLVGSRGETFGDQYRPTNHRTETPQITERLTVM